MESTGNRAEAERLLTIANNLIKSNDLNSARDFAVLAQETDPLLEGSDQIIAIVDVIIASNKKNNDWYAILQIENGPNDDDIHMIKSQYRRLALLLDPDKNYYALADVAYKSVRDAWAVLSDPVKKNAYDNHHLISVLRGGGGGGGDHICRGDGSIWTLCPYCYNLYQYLSVYDGCCMRCPNCQRAFEVVVIPPASLPPQVPGKEAYYCCWLNSGMSRTNWMPTLFPTNGTAWPSADHSLSNNAGDGTGMPPPAQREPVASTAGSSVPKKRGRSRKNPQPQGGV